MLLHESQSNDIENCFVLFLICHFRRRNLSCFNQSFLSVEMGDFP